MDSFSFQLKRLDNFTEFLVINNAFLPHEITMINNIWNEQKSNNAELEGDPLNNTDENIRKSSIVGVLPEDNTKWIFQRLEDLCNQCNNHSYHFNLSGFHEPLQLAKYQEGDFFDWHLDFGIGQSSTRKLSISVQLSDPKDYNGGVLQFQINNKIIDATKDLGTAIIFPSFIMHRVCPIVSGYRKSLVGWVSGDHYV